MEEKNCMTTDKPSGKEIKPFNSFIPNDFCSCLPPISQQTQSCSDSSNTSGGWFKSAMKQRMHTRTLARKNAMIGTGPIRGKHLRTAVSLNDTERVQSLLEAGVDPNSSDTQQRSPLHLAACRGFNDIIRLLLQFGANPNRKDSLGNTPLHLAACTNNIKVITLLLYAGTDISSLDKLGRNPLHLAQSKLRLIKEVQKNGMNPTEVQNLRQQIQQVVKMMICFLSKKITLDSQQTDLDDLSNKLNKLKTSDIIDVDLEVSQLLDDLQVLEINKDTN